MISDNATANLPDCILELEDFLNEPQQYEELRTVRDYRHEAYRKWGPVLQHIKALSAKLGRRDEWRDIAIHGLPEKPQEVLFVRNNTTVHGAFIGGIFWYNNEKCAAALWMPMPKPPINKHRPKFNPDDFGTDEHPMN